MVGLSLGISALAILAIASVNVVLLVLTLRNRKQEQEQVLTLAHQAFASLNEAIKQLAARSPIEKVEADAMAKVKDLEVEALKDALTEGLPLPAPQQKIVHTLDGKEIDLSQGWELF